MAASPGPVLSGAAHVWLALSSGFWRFQAGLCGEQGCANDCAKSRKSGVNPGDRQKSIVGWWAVQLHIDSIFSINLSQPHFQVQLAFF